jgi:hypothetical protein
MSINRPSAGVHVVHDWEDVLARSAAVSHRDRRRFIVTAALAAVLAASAGTALATSGWLDSISPGTPVPLTSLSPNEIQNFEELNNDGEPAPTSSQSSLPPQQLAGYEQAGLTGLRRLGESHGLVFYVFDFQDGHHCYDALRADTGRIVGGTVACPRQADAFPSPDHPIEDLSLVGANSGQPIHTINLIGIAADGVAEVGVLGSDGHVYGKTTVSENMYVSDDLPAQADGPTIAYDANGNTVACLPPVNNFPSSILAAVGCPPEPTQLLQQQRTFAECMRSHGEAQFPDPNPIGGFGDQLKNLDRGSATYEAASSTCGAALRFHASTGQSPGTTGGG